MTEYPKIQTLFERNPETFNVIPGKYRLPEFENIKKWFVTEKIHGTNIRIVYRQETLVQERPELLFLGRTSRAQIPTFLLDYLQRTFNIDKMLESFPDLEPPFLVVLYGEGYGPKVQKGGGNYRKDPAFRLFDVKVDSYWLEPDNIADVAKKLGIKTVPTIGFMSTTTAVKYVVDKPLSVVAQEENYNLAHEAEGIVARTVPMLFTRRGKRLMWKLKCKDFRHPIRRKRNK